RAGRVQAPGAAHGARPADVLARYRHADVDRVLAGEVVQVEGDVPQRAAEGVAEAGRAAEPPGGAGLPHLGAVAVVLHPVRDLVGIDQDVPLGVDDRQAGVGVVVPAGRAGAPLPGPPRPAAP